MLLAGLVPLAAPPIAVAQDAQYWSIQYGPVGQLVGGQLIGGVSDLSATFYNPGALALRNESSYLLSTESVQWEKLSTEPQPGIAVFDTSSSTFGAAPSLLAGVLPRWFGDKNRLAWSFLTRQKLDVRVGQRFTDPLAGASASASESYLDQRAHEEWAGLTLSRALSDSVGIGITWYGVYRGQRTRKELSFLAVAANGQDGLSVSGVSDFEFSHYRMLAKLGAAWRTKTGTPGSPSPRPASEPSAAARPPIRSRSRASTRTATAVPIRPCSQSATEEDLDSEYRSSWALGGGVSRRAGGTRLYASAEWYAPVERFTVLEAPEGAPGASRLTQALRSVLNAGVGFEHVLSEEVSVYGAFHTDFSASEGSARSNVAVSDWDLYHFSGGLSFRFRDNRFTLGASWARGSTDRPLDTPIPPEQLPEAGLDRGGDDPLLEGDLPARLPVRELTWRRARREERAGCERRPCSSPCRAPPRPPRRRSTSWCCATAAA